jgi:hypothetical protein
VEWVVFAGFALFIWWRLVKDDYRRDLEDALDDELSGQDPGLHAAARHPIEPHPTDPRVQS